MLFREKGTSSVISDTYKGLFLCLIVVGITIFLIHGLPNWSKVPAGVEPPKAFSFSLSQTSTLQRARDVINAIDEKERLIDIPSTTDENPIVKESRLTEYIVKDGDSLWQISVKLLGDGNRYHEIIKQNKKIIQDVENISVGIHLKIPCK